MSSNDGFDKFLRQQFQDTKSEIGDHGFTERVLAGLPAKKHFTINRNFIFYIIGALSVFIFFISGGIKLLFISIMSVLNNGLHLTIPTFTSVFVILVFISIPFFIARLELDENAV